MAVITITGNWRTWYTPITLANPTPFQDKIWDILRNDDRYQFTRLNGDDWYKLDDEKRNKNKKC